MSVDKNKRRYMRKPLQYKVEADPVILALLRVMPHLDTLDDAEITRAINYLCHRYGVSVDIEFPIIEYFEE